MLGRFFVSLFFFAIIFSGIYWVVFRTELVTATVVKETMKTAAVVFAGILSAILTLAVVIYLQSIFSF